MAKAPRTGLQTKLHAYMFVLVSLVAVVAGWFFLSKGKAMLRDEYLKRGLSMAATAAQQLEYGLLIADELEIREGLEPYLNDPDLIDIQAFSCAQKRLFTAGDSDPLDVVDGRWCERLSPLEREHTERFSDKFRFYMLTKGSVPRLPAGEMDELEALFGEPEAAPEVADERDSPIGFVRVDLSLDKLRQAELEFARFVLLVVAGILLAALILMGVLARRMVGPIRQLVQKVKIIGSGNLDEEIPALGSDEIGELAEAFAQMKDNLKANMQKLEASNVELRQAQMRLEQRVTEMSELYEMEKGIGDIFELDELLDYITERAMEVIKADAASLLLMNAETGELVFKVAKGPRAAEVRSYTVKPGQGIAGCAARNREPILCADVSGDPRYDGRISKEIGYPIRDVLCVPMIGADNQVIGVVEIMNKQGPEPFNEADMRLLVLISGQASKAIERARYIERERALAAELSEARLKAEYLSRIEQAYEEKTQAYEQLRSAQQQLIQSEKLATVGTLAGGVAHEINNPLGAILTNAQMLDLYSEQEDSKDNIKYIIEGARRCKGIVEKLLSYSRPSTGDRVLLDINKVVEDTLGLLGHQLTIQGVEVGFEPGASVPILANGNELSQVFTNLALNSAFAVARRAETEGPDYKKTVTVATEDLSDPPGVRVRVEDNGTGIQQKDLDRIFDPFYTTKAVGQGTGLGLSVTLNIIRAHGGEVSLDNRPGQGVAFIVTLPAHGEQDPGAESEAGGAPSHGDIIER